MRPRKKNPFEVFGLTPKIVAELPEEVLFRLIKSIYRVLQLTYHPDRGGDPKRAMELNLAYEGLNLEKDPEGFRNFKKAYVERLFRKTLRRELEELYNLNRKLTYLQEVLKERFWQYLVTNGANLNQALFKQGLALKLSLMDVVSQLNLAEYSPSKGRGIFQKELWLWQDNLALRRKAPMRGYERLKNFVVLGFIKREHFSPWFFLKRDLKNEGMFLKDYLAKETFIKEALIYLTSEVKTNRYLFVYHPYHSDRVYLEGLVVKIEEVSALDFLQAWEVAKAEKSFEPTELSSEVSP